MAVRIVWFDREFKKLTHKAIAKGIKASSLFYQGKCREAVNISNVRGTKPARAGEPVHRGTGFGSKNIVWEFDAGRFGRVLATSPSARVGVGRNAIYMFWHEIGIAYSKVGRQKRPWLLPTLRRYQRIIGKLAAAFGGMIR